jgi:hypothetical protein
LLSHFQAYPIGFSFCFLIAQMPLFGQHNHRL